MPAALEAATDAWLVTAGREWGKEAQVTSREARLRQFLKEHSCTVEAARKAAGVDRSDLWRWQMKKPGEPRYIKPSSHGSFADAAVIASNAEDGTGTYLDVGSPSAGSSPRASRFALRALR